MLCALVGRHRIRFPLELRCKAGLSLAPHRGSVANKYILCYTNVVTVGQGETRVNRMCRRGTLRACAGACVGPAGCCKAPSCGSSMQ